MFIINVSEVFIKKFAPGETVHRKHLLPGELMFNFQKIQLPIKFQRKPVRCQTFTNYLFCQRVFGFFIIQFNAREILIFVLHRIFRFRMH